MGGSSSRQSSSGRSTGHDAAPPCCPGCAYPAASSTTPDGATRGFDMCGRCGSVVPLGTAAESAVPPVPHPTARASRVVLQPITESLGPAELQLSEQELMEQVLVPYFRGKQALVHCGARFQIGTTDWKVTACDPPLSLTVESTVVVSEGKPLYGARPLARVRVAAMYETARWVPAGYDLMAKHILPHLRAGQRHFCEGDTFVSRGIQFRVCSCEPANGIVTPRTEVMCVAEPLRDARRVSMVPILETLPNRDKNLSSAERVEKYLRPHFWGRFDTAVQGQEMTAGAVSWVVLLCDPAPKAVVTRLTQLAADGDPLRADYVKEQQMAADEELARSLQREEGGGFMMFADMGPLRPGPREVAFGRRGVGPVGAGAGADPASARMGGGLAAFGPGGPPYGRGRPFRPDAMERRPASPEELLARLNMVLSQMPAGDPHRPVIERLRDQLARLGPRLNRGGSGAGLPAVGASDSARDAASSLRANQVEALPTRVYVAPAPVQAQSGGLEADKPMESFTCMVCLCEFEAGEVLRTLPCFHSYHRDCIDRWLLDSGKCPLCKHPIGGFEDDPES